ncbi:MAG TPA: methyltransferase domain-containing protein [Candidatus Binatia bacterium]
MDKQTSWNPDIYAKNARFVSDLGQPLLALLNPQPGEIILDLGSGDGALTEKIVSTRCRVIGIDASFDQVQASKARGLTAAVVDGHNLCFKQRLDAVFTNAALHWMKQPKRVIDGVWCCLRPSGRFTGEFGGKGNVATIRSALHRALQKEGIDPQTVDPWYYPSPEEYSQLLTKAGFSVEIIELIPRPTKLPGDIIGWLEVFAQPFTRAVSEGKRAGFLDQIRTAVAPALRNPDGTWFADYVRLRFLARKHRDTR